MKLSSEIRYRMFAALFSGLMFGVAFSFVTYAWVISKQISGDYSIFYLLAFLFAMVGIGDFSYELTKITRIVSNVNEEYSKKIEILKAELGQKQQVVEVETKKKKFCRYCGVKNESDATFCEKCGRNITKKN